MKIKLLTDDNRKSVKSTPTTPTIIMSSNNTRPLLRLVQGWKLDDSKIGRDLGTALKLKVKAALRNGEDAAAIDTKTCAEYYTSLHRIDNDYYKKAFPFVAKTTVSGLNMEQLKYINSNEAIDELRMEDRTLFEKFKDKLKTTFSKKN